MAIFRDAYCNERMNKNRLVKK